MTKKELLTRMDSYEIQEWLEYSKVEPLEYRADLRAGIICAVIANVNKGKRKAPYKPEDFMPEKAKKKVQDWKEQKSMVELLNTAFGGKDLRKK